MLRHLKMYRLQPSIGYVFFYIGVDNTLYKASSFFSLILIVLLVFSDTKYLKKTSENDFCFKPWSTSLTLKMIEIKMDTSIRIDTLVEIAWTFYMLHGKHAG